MAKPVARARDSFDPFSEVGKTYEGVPSHLVLEIQKVAQGLAEFGPRKLRRRGPGTEFFESREFDPGIHEQRRINARLSARVGKDMVIENEAEIRQHIYLWRDSTGSMNYKSTQDGLTKRECADIMLLALAKHLTRNEEIVGMLDAKGLFRGANAVPALYHQLGGELKQTGDMPVAQRKLPRNSTVVLFSDFLTDPAKVAAGLHHISGQGLNGYMVMVLDPQEIDFTFKGHVEFLGLEGEETRRFTKAQSMRSAYQQQMRRHIDEIQAMILARGFRLIIQRTDMPLHQGLISLYTDREHAASPVVPGLQP